MRRTRLHVLDVLGGRRGGVGTLAFSLSLFLSLSLSRSLSLFLFSLFLFSLSLSLSLSLPLALSREAVGAAGETSLGEGRTRCDAAAALPRACRRACSPAARQDYRRCVLIPCRRGTEHVIPFYSN